MLRGVDVSSHQPTIDWAVVARSNDFAIVKATGGLRYENPEYAAQVAGARAAGLVVGHYHFAHESSLDGAGWREPEAEADHFLAVADVRAGELVALDIEDTAVGGNLSDWALRWLRRVEAALGCRPLLYTFPNYLDTRGLGTPALANYPLWYAYYRTPYSASPFPITPRPWPRIAIWQWSGGTRVAGIPNDTDENLFDGDRAALVALGRPGLVQAEAQPTGDPGFPGALQPDGTTRLGEVDFGGTAVCVEEVTVRVRNATGERYERTWAGHALRPWVVRS